MGGCAELRKAGEMSRMDLIIVPATLATQRMKNGGRDEEIDDVCQVQGVRAVGRGRRSYKIICSWWRAARRFACNSRYGRAFPGSP